ncbi:hypothetical protein F4780DRAFT_768415 [Xylariomycetidae sp. FL0641]|nr:hypothetical protein F4780DRAFT_768415 [Xylariomycetidae sp. FL0641]
MSVARPARCLFARGLASAGQPASPRCSAPFHSSAQLAKRKPRFKSIRAEEMGLTSPEKIQEFTQQSFPDYTPEEKEILRQRYTPEQMEALEAGEAAIDPQDFAIQGRIRRDPYKLPYLDDFTKIHPVIDKRQKIHPPPDPNARFLTEHEFFQDLEGRLQDLIPKDVNFDNMTTEEIEELLEKRIDFAEVEKEYFHGLKTMTDKSPQNTSLAPTLGKGISGVTGMYTNPVDPEDEGLDDEGIYQNLKKRTGMKVRHILDMQVKVLVNRNVSNQTRLGKIRSSWILAIAGNGTGRLGVGVAKGTELVVTTMKAKMLAIQNMQPIRRYENRTIFGRVRAKLGATIVELEARPPGFGLRASHRLFEIFRMVGIHDIAAKMPRGRNPMNSVMACIRALQDQKDPDEIAIGRGKKMVDVRKVYYNKL